MRLIRSSPPASMRSRWKIFSSRSLAQISPQCAASRARHGDGSLGERQCAQIGIRVVDLYTAFDTDREADFHEHFSDALHPRPRSYPVRAQIVYDNIKGLLA